MSRTVTLTGVDGSIWDLSTGPIVFAGANLGLYGTVPVQIAERAAPLIPGSFVTSVRHSSRDLVLPLTIIGDDPVDVEEALNGLALALDPMVGSVSILVVRPDGTQRTISGRYIAGLDGLELAYCDTRELKVAVAIRCHEEPYWTDPAGETIAVIPPAPVFTSGTTATDDADTATDEAIPVDGFSVGIEFDDPAYGFSAVLPFSGDAGGVVITTIDNQGDVDAWPVFTINGPGAVVQATNITTGKFWAWDGALDANKVLTVDTRPGRRAVEIQGQNRFGGLADGSELFPFIPGPQTVAFRFDGTDALVSTFQASWLERYLTC